MFSDASERAYGSVSYPRTEDTPGWVYMAFYMAFLFSWTPYIQLQNSISEMMMLVSVLRANICRDALDLLDPSGKRGHSEGAIQGVPKMELQAVDPKDG